MSQMPHLAPGLRFLPPPPEGADDYAPRHLGAAFGGEPIRPGGERFAEPALGRLLPPPAAEPDPAGYVARRVAWGSFPPLSSGHTPRLLHSVD